VRMSAHAKVNASAAKASVIPATMTTVSVGIVKIPRVPSSAKN
jgi:ABC-type iron transport system FetAB permease component